MNIKDLLSLLNRSITTLNSERAVASSSGDVERVLMIDMKLLETETTIAQLKTLPLPTEQG